MRHFNATMIDHYDFGDYLSREEKLRILTDADGLQGIDWQAITPNEKHDWINQRGDVLDSFIPLGAKRNEDTETVFDMFAMLRKFREHFSERTCSLT